MKVATGIMLTFLLGAMFASLFGMSADMSMAGGMSADMSMAGGMSDCPFMDHQEALCPMNLADHIGAWQSAFLAVVPAVTLLLAAAGVIALALSTTPHLLVVFRQQSPPLLYKQLRERTYSFFCRPFQEMFARGILHPKLF